MKYLENNICEFEPLFQLSKQKKNIVSISFFKIYGGGYKNFNLYIDGFMNIHKYVIEEKIYNFTIRLFIDLTIKNDTKLFERLTKLERVEIIIYSCKKYIHPSDSDFHIGTFGMFVRFFPLFDFPNNDSDIVLISDMDDDMHFNFNIKTLKLIDKKKMNELYLFTYSNISRNIIHNFNYLHNEKITGYFISPRLISFKRLPNSIIINYINNIDIYYKEAIKSYEYLLTSDSGKKTYLKDQGSFIYGIDEYFLNSELTKYIIDNKYPYGIHIKFNLLYNIFFYIENYEFKKDKLKLIGYLLDYILNNLKYKYDKNSSVKNKYNLIDKMSYTDYKNKNKKNSYLNDKDKNSEELINYYIYKAFLYNYKNSNYRFYFKRDLYQMIKLYNLFGVYNFEAIIYYNKDSTYTINFINKKMFNKEKLYELKNFAKKYANIFD